MDRAAEADDEDAARVANEYRRIQELIPKANNGDGQAQAELAACMMALGGSLDQAGPLKDYEESLKWAEKAAEQGIGEAMWILALAYQHGRGVEPDISKTISYYRAGAETGDAACQHSLGCEYYSGENLEKNQQKAFDLYKKSAEQGYGLALQALGHCYQAGIGCKRNWAKALEWYEKSLDVIKDSQVERTVDLLRQLRENDLNWGKDPDWYGE